MSDSRVVLVTGGSRGIGRALVQRFARDGYRVATCATSQAGIDGISEAALAHVCDVSDKDAVAALVAETVAQLGRLDVVVNNAGVAGENSLAPDDDDAFWHRIFDVNVHGTYYVSKAALPHLPDGSGRVINIGSTLSLKGVPDQTAYTAAKHAVLGFTRALSHHAAPRGITVNAICPGWTETDMAAQRGRELSIDLAQMAAGVPLGRVAQPNEVAGLALWLCGDDARSVTGQALVVDGGSLA
jgi:NAD(P)-dependent dehydrogenase (short-subunit alcohol dehydrogenase family)